MSDRASIIWSKLTQWYGSLFTERYGVNPPRDWVQVLNAPDKDTINLALTTVKNSHPKFPPTLMEMSDAIRKVTKQEAKYDVRTVLAEYVLREYHAGRIGLSKKQLGSSWNWIANLSAGLDYQGQMRENQNCEYVGVFIPPDPTDKSTRGWRILFDEIDQMDVPLLLAKSRSRYSAHA